MIPVSPHCIVKCFHVLKVVTKTLMYVNDSDDEYIRNLRAATDSIASVESNDDYSDVVDTIRNDSLRVYPPTPATPEENSPSHPSELIDLTTPPPPPMLNIACSPPPFKRLRLRKI